MDYWLLIGVFMLGYGLGSFVAGFSYAKRDRKELDSLRKDIDRMMEEVSSGD